MTLKKMYLTGVPGQTYLQHPLLAYSEIMLLLREGQIVVETDSTPLDNTFKVTTSTGRIDLAADLPILCITESTDTYDIIRPEIFTIEYKQP